MHHEFYVHDAAPVVFEVEQVAAVGVGVEHFFSHRRDFAAQLIEITLLAQHRAADVLEFFSDPGVAGAETGAGQRLMFPHPGVLALVFVECLNRTYQQAAGAIRAQPQIGFIQHTRRREAGQPVVEALRESRVVFCRLRRCVIIKEDQIEIGSVAELLAPQLAVGDDRKTR